MDKGTRNCPKLGGSERVELYRRPTNAIRPFNSKHRPKGRKRERKERRWRRWPIDATRELWRPSEHRRDPPSSTHPQEMSREKGRENIIYIGLWRPWRKGQRRTADAPGHGNRPRGFYGAWANHPYFDFFHFLNYGEVGNGLFNN